MNYGGHVGNDTILSLIHEARMQYLAHYGYTEFKMAGTGIILGDVAIVYKAESFYGDIIEAAVAPGDFDPFGFELFYRFRKKSGDGMIEVARAKTGIICFNYSEKKVEAVPAEVVEKLSYE